MKPSKLNWFARRAELNSTAARRLLASLEKNRKLNQKLLSISWPLQEFKLIQAWQQQRMSNDYADFSEQPDYQPAVNFFLQELYGDFSFIDRNQDLHKVYPVMVKLLPATMLDTLTDALTFQAHSLKLDMQMAEAKHQDQSQSSASAKMDLEHYIKINRDAVLQQHRRRQVGQVVSLGKALVKAAEHRMLLRLLKMMRLPAKSAGFGQLHEFLENGLSAFKKMPDAGYFLNTVEQRETAFIDKLY
ncbi:MAG: hypothetical protein L3J24_10655 [Xanthomonadales bacterium]|nr:hypothetical protein [Xanthomonadales bacterium]